MPTYPHSRLLSLPLSVVQWILTLEAAVTLADHCPLSTTTDISFSMGTRRNTTGHWIITVEATREDATNRTAGHQQMAGGMSVLVGQHTSSCDSVDVTKLTATASVEPTSGSGAHTDSEAMAVTSPSSQMQSSSPAPVTTTQVSPDVPVAWCCLPPGYEMVLSQGYYKLHQTRKPWYEARRVCQEEGGHLMVVDSDEENVVLTAMWGRLGVTAFYLGVSDDEQEGEFMTVLGDRVPYTNWWPGQPDGGRAQNCVAAGLWSDPRWWDYDCSIPILFVCELSAARNCTV